MKKLAVVFALAAILDAVASHRQVCFYGNGGWEDVSGVDIKVESKNPHHHSDDWRATEFKHGQTFAYINSAEAGDVIRLRVKKGSNYLESKKSISSEGPIAWTFPGDSSLQLATFTTSVRHLDMWKDFVTELRNADAKDVAAIIANMPETWENVRKEFAGFEVNIFIDGLVKRAGHSAHLEFKSSGDTRSTTKKIQKSGAVFAAWSIPKKAGTLGVNFGGVVTLIQIDKVAKYTAQVKVDGEDVGIIIMVNTNHKKMSSIWREVQKFRYRNKSEHPYWNSDTKSWKVSALENLYDKVRADKSLMADHFESDGETLAGPPESSWKLIIIGCVMALILIPGIYYFCCWSTEADSDSDSREASVQLPPKTTSINLIKPEDHEPTNSQHGASNVVPLVSSTNSGQLSPRSNRSNRSNRSR